MVGSDLKKRAASNEVGLGFCTRFKEKRDSQAKAAIPFDRYQISLFLFDEIFPFSETEGDPDHQGDQAGHGNDHCHCLH